MSDMENFTLITGMQHEAVLVRKKAKEMNRQLAVLVAGPGGIHAAQAVRQAREAGAEGIVSFGTCGGLDPGLVSGAVVLPDVIVDSGGNHLASTCKAFRVQLKKILEKQFDVFDGPLAQSGTAVETASDKAALLLASRAQAVDMESGILADLARKNSLAFLACRVVLDQAGQNVPAGVLRILDDNGKVSIFRLIKYLVFNWPGTETIKTLSHANAIATERLANIAGIIAELGRGRT